MLSPLTRFFSQHAINATNPQGLTYCLQYWIRFDLPGPLSPDDIGYFPAVLHRATTLFEATFKPTDEVLVVYQDNRYKRHRIRSNSYLFRQLGISKRDVRFKNRRAIANPNAYHEGRWVQILFPTTAAQIPHRALLAAISHQDFPSPETQALCGQLFFFNQTSSVIFYMYDDRGLVISSDRAATSRPFYQRYNEWILDYDRPVIVNLFALSEPNS